MKINIRNISICISILLVIFAITVTSFYCGPSRPDYPPPAPPIVRIDDGGDGVITRLEAGAGVSVMVQGEPNTTYNITPQGCTVAEGNTGALNASGRTTINLANFQDGQDVVLSITLTNPAGVGQPGTATSHVTLTGLSSPLLDFDDNGDGFINSAEAEAGVGLIITGEAGANYSLTPENCTIQEGNTGNLGESDTKTVTLTGFTDDTEVTITASLVDAYGTESNPTSISAIVDLTAPSDPTIAINDGGDGFINMVEYNQGITITLTGEQGELYRITPTNVEIEDGNEGQFTSATMNLSLTNMGDGTVEITAVALDEAGNESNPASTSTQADVTAPPIEEFAIDDGGDGYINTLEYTGGADLSIKSEPGANYTLTIENCVVQEGNTGVIPESGQALLHLQELVDGNTAVLTIVLTDDAGNATPATTIESTPDITAPTVHFTHPNGPCMFIKRTLYLFFSESVIAETLQITDESGNLLSQAAQHGWSDSEQPNSIYQVAPVDQWIPGEYTLLIIAEDLAGNPMEQSITKKVIDFGWVEISGGTFMMGDEWEEDDFGESDPNTRPNHQVTVSDFYLMAMEVTFEQYNMCVADGVCNPSRYADDPNYNTPNFPVVGVSWYDAQAFAWWADGGLPTEAQWEYAAGNGSAHWRWSLDEDNFHPVNYVYDRWSPKLYPLPVGGRPASVLGLYDMSGNAFEWCYDFYIENWYSQAGASGTDPVCVNDSSGFRVARGGSWGNTTIIELSVVNRTGSPPQYGITNTGIRMTGPADDRRPYTPYP